MTTLCHALTVGGSLLTRQLNAISRWVETNHNTLIVTYRISILQICLTVFGKKNNRNSPAKPPAVTTTPKKQNLQTIKSRVNTTSTPEGNVPCPHCGRKFEKNAAQRHIPICANVANKPKPKQPVRR